MNKEEFIQSLVDAHFDNVVNKHGELNNKLLAISNLEQDSDQLFEQGKHTEPSFLKEISNVPTLFQKASDCAEAYQIACEKQQHFLSVVDKLKTIDFSKIPVKYCTGVQENYDYKWGSTKLNQLAYVASFDNDEGFSISLDKKDKFHDFSPLTGAFDTKDQNITSILNEAGFYSFDQVQKLNELTNIMRINNYGSSYGGVIATLLSRKKDPCSILEMEFRALSIAAFEYSYQTAENFFHEFKELLPVPLSNDVFQKLQENNFMEPVKIMSYTETSQIDSSLLKRCVIGDCTIDFYKVYPNSNEITADLTIPVDKLTLIEKNHLSETNYFDSDNYSKVFYRDLSYELREFRKLPFDSFEKLDVPYVLNSKDNQLIREFLVSPEMKKIFNQIPTHCLIQDTYKSDFPKEKTAQR